MSVRLLARRSLAVVLGALCFLAGGLVVPQFVSATVSSGEREAFFPMPPTRIMDTRTEDSPFGPGVPVGPGQVLTLKVGGFRGVSPTAGAAVLNVTITDATQQSLLTIYPSGTPRPTASSLNFVPGQVVPNAVTVKIGADKQVNVYNDKGSVHVVVDVNGYYENVTFDDRYDTKAQTDAKVATGITTPNHIASPQVADGSLGGADLADSSVTGADLADSSVTGAEVADGSLALDDLTGGGDYEEYTLPDLAVPAGGCQLVSISLGIANAYRLVVPMRIAAGVIFAANISASPVVLNLSGNAGLHICNRGFAAFNTTAPTLDYHLI
jgi:hypothetical protein